MNISARRLRLLAGAVVVLALLTYAAWLALSARSALQAARSDAEHLKAALADRDEHAVRSSLADLQEHAGTAHRRTSGVVWRALGVLPVVGDDTRAVATASRVVADAADVVGPVLDVGGFDADRFTPKDGRIDLAAVASLSDPLAKAAKVMDAGRADVDAVDAGDLLGAFASDWRDFADEVDTAASAVTAAHTASEVLPVVLGADHPTRTLIVFDTPAEPRAIGGMPASVAELTSDDGRLTFGRQRAAASFDEVAVSPLTDDETARFGPQLGSDMRDAAFTPHFPRVAELVAAHWKQAYGGNVDTVLSLDPVTLGYLLDATGPVTVDGVKLTSANLADYLMHQVYLDIADPADQDPFFQKVAATVFERIRGGHLSASDLLEGISRAVDERRIFVHSFDPAVQARLAGTAGAGEVVSDVHAAPQVGVYVNDATAAKLGYYLDYDVKVHGHCTDGGRTLTGTMRVRSMLKPGTKLPAYVAGAGDNGVAAYEHLISVELFGPQGGTLSAIRFDGKDQPDAEITPYRGHRTTSVAVFLEPGDHHEITWTMKTPSRKGVQVDVAAGVQPEAESSSLPAC